MSAPSWSCRWSTADEKLVRVDDHRAQAGAQILLMTCDVGLGDRVYPFALGGIEPMDIHPIMEDAVRVGFERFVGDCEQALAVLAEFQAMPMTRPQWHVEGFSGFPGQGEFQRD